MLVLVVVLAKPLCSLELSLIGVYRNHGGYFRSHATSCRYRPSCSRYALAVLERDGFWAGNFHVAKRLGACSPVGWCLDTFTDTSTRYGAAAGDVWRPEENSRNTGF